jgi:hypothetical protein
LNGERNMGRRKKRSTNGGFPGTETNVFGEFANRAIVYEERHRQALELIERTNYTESEKETLRHKLSTLRKEQLESLCACSRDALDRGSTVPAAVRNAEPAGRTESENEPRRRKPRRPLALKTDGIDANQDREGA